MRWRRRECNVIVRFRCGDQGRGSSFRSQKRKRSSQEVQIDPLLDRFGETRGYGWKRESLLNELGSGAKKDERTNETREREE